MSDSTELRPSHRLAPPTIAMGGGTFDVAADGSSAPRRHPDWIKARIPSGETYQEVRRLLHGLSLHTVCEEAHCPNVGECWDQRTATIMILGDTCTRACGFCAVKTGKPLIHDLDEPRRVAEAIRGLGLEHVVITSVARDDLDDGGAGIFAETIRRLRDACPGMGVEVLIPDFNGEEMPLRTVMAARPDILNHNVETVARLQKPVRKRARYDRSLGVLERAKAYAREFGAGDGGPSPAVHTKSSIMVGLGETQAGAPPDVRGPSRRRLRHPDDRAVSAALARAPARRALLPSRRVRRDARGGAGAGLQARGVGAPRAVELPRSGSGSGRRGAACGAGLERGESEWHKPQGRPEDRFRGAGHLPGRRLTERLPSGRPSRRGPSPKTESRAGGKSRQGWIVTT